MKDIKKAYGINLIDNEYTFYEHQRIPSDHKFYNRIFTIQILKLNIINNIKYFNIFKIKTYIFNKNFN